MKGLSLGIALLLLSDCQAQTFQWVRAGFGTKDSQVNSLSYTDGRINATGGFEQLLTFYNQSLTSTMASSFTAQWSAAGELRWVQQSQNLLESSGRGYSEGKISCVDSHGNIYVGYLITSDAAFGLTVVPAASPTMVIVKYNPSGDIVWISSFRGELAIELRSIVVGTDDNCCVGLNFEGQLDVGSNISSTRNAEHAPDGLLLKLNSAGAVSWIKQLPGSFGQVLMSLAVDKGGNFCAAGHFDDRITLSPAVSFTETGLGHLFIAKYDATGNFKWARQMGGSHVDVINGIATDMARNIVICGYFGHIGSGTGNATATFGPTTLTTAGTYGLGDGFVAKYDEQGEFKWVKAFRSVGWEKADAVVTTSKGDIYVSGTANTETHFGLLSMPAGNGSDDGFVAKYSGAGAEQWVSGYGGSNSDSFAGAALTTDDQGHLYVGGSFSGSAQFGSITATGYRSISTAFIAQLTDAQALSTKMPAQFSIALQVYPNPGAGLVQVSWSADTQPLQLSLLDMLGHVVHTEMVNPTETKRQLHLSALSPGVYVLQLQTVAAGKLIKRLLLQ